MNVLFLDDMEDRHIFFKEHFKDQFNITHVFDYESCISELKSSKFDMVFLDHDLSHESILCDPNEDIGEKTGSDVVKWIVENLEINVENAPGFVIHSLNPAGRRNMYLILKDAGFDVVEIPFIQISWYSQDKFKR